MFLWKTKQPAFIYSDPHQESSEDGSFEAFFLTRWFRSEKGERLHLHLDANMFYPAVIANINIIVNI